MNSKRLLRLACLCFWLVDFSAAAVTTRDASTMFGAYSTAFYNQTGTNGDFQASQNNNNDSYFWVQANMIESVIDAYEWNSNSAGEIMITNLLNEFIKNNGKKWTSTTAYNDDIMWACIAFARGGRDTGQTNFCDLAKTNFNAAYTRGYDTNLGGGLYWEYPENATKNSCVSGPAAIASALIYQIYGDTNYLNKATNLYAWERSVLFNANTGAIFDHISTNGVVNTVSLTYNQGTFIGAADLLGQTNDAQLAADFTMRNMNNVGVLPQYGAGGNNSGFNDIFLRWMTHFMRDHNLQGWYETWLQTNAAAAWAVRRTSDNLSWCQWQQPSPVGSNFMSWDCLPSFEALQAAAPTQDSSLPDAATDYVGYWPLDATNGNTTADVSGDGNNGMVTGASLSPSGRVNGCLNFNGTSSEVEITNVLCDDFTIAFWVKTTQSTPSGQWHVGAGLVDGNVTGTGKNDFGTALCAGKFAFGVGNPDTTILSTTSITNGAWHHCVATRQQATGQMCVYVDGALQATGTGGNNTLGAPANLFFGAIASGGGFFNGSLDEVQIFSRALNSNEVASLYGCTVYSPPASPASLAAVTGNAQAQLNWPTASAATSYNVKRATTSNGPYTLVANVAGDTYIDTGVVNDRTYYYEMSAVNAVGESTNSAPVSVNITPLIAWFRADALTGLANGAPVSLWADFSGNGYNALQTATGNQPTYVTGAVNGLPAIRFKNASNTYLWLYRPVQDDFTIIIVYESSQGLNTGTDYGNGAGLVGGEQSGTVNDYGISLNANGQVLAGTGNPDTSIQSGTGYANGQPHVVSFTRTKSSGAIALYVDGTLVSSSTGGTKSLTAPNFLAIGAGGTLNNYLTGDIPEVQIYNAALSGTDRLALEQALKCKYDITGGSTPSNPAGLSGTAGNRQISLSWTLEAGTTGYNLWHSTNSGASYQEVAAGLTTGSYVDTNAANGLVNDYKLTAVDGCGTSGYSAVAGVNLPLPALGMSTGAGSLGLTWPGWANDWVLYTATNLTPPAVWSPVTNVAGSNGGQFNLSLPFNSQMHFFRLSAP